MAYVLLRLYAGRFYLLMTTAFMNVMSIVQAAILCPAVRQKYISKPLGLTFISRKIDKSVYFFSFSFSTYIISQIREKINFSHYYYIIFFQNFQPYATVSDTSFSPCYVSLLRVKLPVLLYLTTRRPQSAFQTTYRFLQFPQHTYLYSCRL